MINSVKLGLSLLLITNYAFCYNIEIRKGSMKYVLSPLQRELAARDNSLESLSEGTLAPPRANGEDENSVDGPVASSLSSSFFGYDFEIGDDIMYVGSPKTTLYNNDLQQAETIDQNRNATGDLHECIISRLFSRTQPIDCQSNVPIRLSKADTFGLSVALANDDTLTACAPPKEQNCDIVIYNPGYCYNYQRGRWSADAYTEALKCAAFNLDIIFLLDGSGSVQESGFEVVKQWVKNVILNFDISDASTQIGVIQYSHYYEGLPDEQQLYLDTEINLGEFTNYDDLFARLDNTELHGFTTHTAQALNYSVQDFMKSERFNTSSKVLILLTDGRSTVPADVPASAAYVRSLGINTFAVGVGEAKVLELREIATGTNTDDNVYYVSQFDQLNEIVNQLREAIITVALEDDATKPENNVNLNKGLSGCIL